MSFTIIATDRTGKVVKTYKVKEAPEALGMVAILAEKGFTAHISEGPIKARKDRETRANPGELLILSGFVPNPGVATTKSMPAGLMEAGQEAEDVARQFKRFHQGAEVLNVYELPDDAVAPQDTHWWSLGELVAVIYQVPAHSGKAPGPPFQHMFGEVGHSKKVIKANRPLLCSTADGKYLAIVHRHKPGSKKTYKVRPEGIVG